MSTYYTGSKANTTRLEFKNTKGDYYKIWDYKYVNETRFTFEGYKLAGLFTTFRLDACANYYMIEDLLCCEADWMTGLGCNNLYLTDNNDKKCMRCWCRFGRDIIDNREANTTFILRDEDGNGCAIHIYGYISLGKSSKKRLTNREERIVQYDNLNIYMESSFKLLNTDVSEKEVRIKFIDIRSNKFSYRCHPTNSLWDFEVKINGTSLPKLLWTTYKKLKFHTEVRVCCLDSKGSVTGKTPCSSDKPCWCGFLNFLRSCGKAYQRIKLVPSEGSSVRHNAWLEIWATRSKESKSIDVKLRFDIDDKYWKFQGNYDDEQGYYWS